MIRQDSAAGQLGDDRRVDAGELRVIHEEPGFSRPAHDRGLDSRFLGVGGRESCVQRPFARNTLRWSAAFCLIPKA